MERFLGRLPGDLTSNCAEIPRGITVAITQILHRFTHHSIGQMWKSAKHGKATPSELLEHEVFEAAIQSWKTDTERKGTKVMVEGAEGRIRSVCCKE